MKYHYKDGNLKEISELSEFDSRTIYEQLRAAGVTNYTATLDDGAVIIETNRALTTNEQTALKTKLDTMKVR